MSTQSDKCVEAAFQLSESLSKDQRDLLLILCDECKRLGASSEQIAPIFAAVFLSSSVPSQEEIDHAILFLKKSGYME